MTLLFRAYLDETGTDGTSHYAVVAGGVALNERWDYVEVAWDRLLSQRGVKQFHTKEFNHRQDDFKGWSKLKCQRFVGAQEKILEKAPVMSFAVAVNSAEHAAVKKKMRGIKNFKAASDFGLAFRMIRFFVCDTITKRFPDSKVSFVVEDGPYSGDANVIYQDIVSTRGAKYRPAMYAEMLNGFASIPKGYLRGLEVADYLAGRAISDLQKGRLIKPGRPNQIAVRATPAFLRTWHKDMLKEREHRKQHAAKRRAAKKA